MLSLTLLLAALSLPSLPANVCPDPCVYYAGHCFCPIP